MVAEPRTSPTVSLELTRTQEWTLHHVLLDRIEEGDEQSTGTASIPSLAIYRAFDRLDVGYQRFTMDELEEMQTLLGEYQRSTSWWEAERGEIEEVLQRIAVRIDERSGDG